jgi:hypothetical protein
MRAVEERAGAVGQAERRSAHVVRALARSVTAVRAHNFPRRGARPTPPAFPVAAAHAAYPLRQSTAKLQNVSGKKPLFPVFGSGRKSWTPCPATGRTEFQPMSGQEGNPTASLKFPGWNPEIACTHPAHASSTCTHAPMCATRFGVLWVQQTLNPKPTRDHTHPRARHQSNQQLERSHTAPRHAHAPSSWGGWEGEGG